MTNISVAIVAKIQTLVARVREELGQDTLEWALIGGLIALGLILGFVLFDDAVTNMVNGVARCIDFTSSTVCNPGP